jgi:hypothetical protein
MLPSVRQPEQPVAADAEAVSAPGVLDLPFASAATVILAVTAAAQSTALAKEPGASEFGSGHRTASAAAGGALEAVAAAAVVVSDVAAALGGSLGRS